MRLCQCLTQYLQGLLCLAQLLQGIGLGLQQGRLVAVNLQPRIGGDYNLAPALILQQQPRQQHMPGQRLRVDLQCLLNIQNRRFGLLWLLRPGIGLLRQFLSALCLSLLSLCCCRSIQCTLRLGLQVSQSRHIGAQAACGLRLLERLRKVAFGIGFVSLVCMLPGGAGQCGLCHGTARHAHQGHRERQRTHAHFREVFHASTSEAFACCNQAFCCRSKAF